MIGGAVATWVQIRIARDGQMIERFTRAIEHLGSEKLDIRLGGIYALERFALNSPDDRSAVTPILGAYVRGHPPWPVSVPGAPEHPTRTVDDHLSLLTNRVVDVQTAMHVLARRPGHASESKLFLSRVDLPKMELSEAGLSDTYFRHANLAGSWMPRARLERCELVDADLRHVNLQGACLIGADLRGAYLQGAGLRALSSPARCSTAQISPAFRRTTPHSGLWVTRARTWKARLLPVTTTMMRRGP